MTSEPTMTILNDDGEVLYEGSGEDFHRRANQEIDRLRVGHAHVDLTEGWVKGFKPVDTKLGPAIEVTLVYPMGSSKLPDAFWKLGRIYGIFGTRMSLFNERVPVRLPGFDTEDE